MLEFCLVKIWFHIQLPMYKYVIYKLFMYTNSNNFLWIGLTANILMEVRGK